MLAAQRVSHYWNRSSRPSRTCRLRVCNAVPKLTYFPITGRAETARLLFTIGGVAFEVSEMGLRSSNESAPSRSGRMAAKCKARRCVTRWTM
jgi:hypothetical protein